MGLHLKRDWMLTGSHCRSHLSAESERRVRIVFIRVIHHYLDSRCLKSAAKIHFFLHTANFSLKILAILVQNPKNPLPSRKSCRGRLLLLLIHVEHCHLVNTDNGFDACPGLVCTNLRLRKLLFVLFLQPAVVPQSHILLSRHNLA